MGPIPEMRGKWCLGSQDGWIGLLDERSEVSFLNLLTRSHIHLPSVTTIPTVTPVFDNDSGALSAYLHTMSAKHFDVEYYSLPYFRGGNFKKIVLSSTPIAGGSYAAMAIFGVYKKPAFAAEGSGEWILLDDAPSVLDIIYRDGKFLLVVDDGSLWSLDPTTTTSPRMIMIAKGWGEKFTSPEKFLVESSDDLLQVWMRSTELWSHPEYPEVDVRIIKFIPERAEWVPIECLGKHSLFLGLSYSLSLSSKEVPDIKPNCLYVTEILWNWIHEENPKSIKRKLVTRDVFVFNFEDTSFERYCPPDPRLNWPPPLWFTPTLL